MVIPATTSSCSTSENRALLKDAFGLLAYPNPRDGPMSHVLDPSKREPLARELNSAILGTKPSQMHSRSAFHTTITHTHTQTHTHDHADSHAHLHVLFARICKYATKHTCTHCRQKKPRFTRPLTLCPLHVFQPVSLSLLAKSTLEQVVQQTSTCLSTMLEQGMGQAAFLSIGQFMGD